MRKASEELGLSLRQIKRVRKWYLHQGKDGLISLKRGKESNRKLCRSFRDKVMRQMRERYVDFGSTLASEKLERVGGQKLSAETLRKWQFFSLKGGKKKDILLLKAAVDTRITRHVKVRADATPYDPQFKEYFKEKARKKH